MCLAEREKPPTSRHNNVPTAPPPVRDLAAHCFSYTKHAATLGAPSPSVAPIRLGPRQRGAKGAGGKACENESEPRVKTTQKCSSVNRCSARATAKGSLVSYRI